MRSPSALWGPIHFHFVVDFLDLFGLLFRLANILEPVTRLINRRSLRTGCLQRSSSMLVDGAGAPSARRQPHETSYEMTRRC